MKLKYTPSIAYATQLYKSAGILINDIDNANLNIIAHILAKSMCETACAVWGCNSEDEPLEVLLDNLWQKDLLSTDDLLCWQNTIQMVSYRTVWTMGFNDDMILKMQKSLEHLLKQIEIEIPGV